MIYMGDDGNVTEVLYQARKSWMAEKVADYTEKPARSQQSITAGRKSVTSTTPMQFRPLKYNVDHLNIIL
jgi:hypothetical protein